MRGRCLKPDSAESDVLDWSLINRSQSNYAKTGINEKGFLTELETPFLENSYLSFSYGDLTDRNNKSELTEHYSQFDFQELDLNNLNHSRL